MNNSGSSSWLRWRRLLPSLLFLLATVWVARFWYSSGFGLYEDDYWRVSSSMYSSAQDLGGELAPLILDYGRSQGRPFHDGLIRALSFIGGRLGELRGVFFLAYGCVVLNVLLFFLLLRRVSAIPSFVWLGALAFALFPADTTHAFLTHSFGVHPSMTFLLLASHAYLSGRRWLAFVLATGSLFCYETVFPLFLAVPLLERSWNRAFARRLALHAALTAAILGAVTLLRASSGEGRVSRMEPLETAETALSNIVVGPAVGWSTYFWRPFEALPPADPALWWFFGIAALAFVVLLSLVELPVSSKGENRRILAEMGWWALTGLLLLVLGYLLALTVTVSATHGRSSRVHFAATPGAAMLLAAGLTATLHFAARARVALVAVLTVSALFGSLVAFGAQVQQGYAEAWALQRQFWRRFGELAPDLDDGVLVLVNNSQLNRGMPIAPWGWANSLVLPQVFRYPKRWKVEPQIHGLPVNWRGQLEIVGRIRDLAPEKSPHHKLADDNVILIEYRDRRFVRASSPLRLGKLAVPLRDAPSEPGRLAWEPRPLGRLILDIPR